MITRAELSTAGTVLFPFFRALAHEMSGPLVSVLGYAQLNLEAPSSADGLREDLLEIETSAQRLRGHVSVLGRMSRYLPEEERCSAEELVSDIKLLLTPTARQIGCEVDWKTEGDLSDMLIQGNPWILRVTTLALLGAACQGSPSPVRVNVTSDEEGLSISYPSLVIPQSDKLEPNQVGCHSLGERLLEYLAAHLEKSPESCKLYLPKASA